METPSEFTCFVTDGASDKLAYLKVYEEESVLYLANG